MFHLNPFDMRWSISFLLLFLFLESTTVFAQSYELKQPVNAAETHYLQTLMAQIAQTDQQCRKYLGADTMDDELIAKMDSAYEAGGIEAYMKYASSLNLTLDSMVEDSLWQVQHAIDFQNHLLLRGVFLTYGFLPKELLGEHHYVPLLVLMHPPKDWDVPTYLAEYSLIFREEVQAGRMPSKTFATFYDNMKAKILREPQLYGTNQQFDPATQQVLPPIIESLELSNAARKEIGMEPLSTGEYRLAGEQ